jgi:chromosome segregation ATPase
MSNDIRYFKRKIFGGFDSHDVIKYIEELAGQRNKYKYLGEKLEKELAELNGELKRLQDELANADKRFLTYKVSALESASANLTELENSFSDIRMDMEATTSQVASEFDKITGTLEMLTSVMDKTGMRFSELRSIVEDEKCEMSVASELPHTPGFVL